MYIRTHTCMRARTHACTHARTHACTHACTHTRMHTRMHAPHTHTRTHTHTHTYTYTHTHTHTQVKVVLEWFKDVSQVFTTASTTGTNQTTPQPHSMRIPVQVLVTGRTVNMLLPSCERKEEQGENGRENKWCPILKTSFFNPVMLANVGKDTSFEFSLFNLAAGITYGECRVDGDRPKLSFSSLFPGEEREEYKCLPDARYMSVVETRPGTVSNSTSSDCNSSLPANLLTAKVAYKENEGRSTFL